MAGFTTIYRLSVIHEPTGSPLYPDFVRLTPDFVQDKPEQWPHWSLTFRGNHIAVVAPSHLAEERPGYICLSLVFDDYFLKQRLTAKDINQSLSEMVIYEEPDKRRYTIALASQTCAAQIRLQDDQGKTIGGLAGQIKARGQDPVSLTYNETAKIYQTEKRVWGNNFCNARLVFTDSTDTIVFLKPVCIQDLARNYWQYQIKL